MNKAREIGRAARTSAAKMATASTEHKNRALRCMAGLLSERRNEVLTANRGDITAAKRDGVSENLLKRLEFGGERVDSRIRCLGKIESLPDPVGQTFHAERGPNGLEASRVRVPLGVILMIYEARPHVTVNAGAFCLKSGNAAILRGGSEAKRCNALLGALWQESLGDAGLPKEAIQVISTTHEETRALLQADDLIDLVIPRGGAGLIKAVAENSRIPVVKHFEGICHVYIDNGANLEQAIRIALDSKCLMPEVCNAMETLLVAEGMTGNLPEIVKAFQELGVRIRGCRRVRECVDNVDEATEADWRIEYLEPIVSIRVVKDVEEAIRHINEYGSHHTDSIVTTSERRARDFVREVDSAVVLVNASTMFCDGESLGMGAEIGISTDRLHARGPMGLEELTTYKHVIHGMGNVMGGPSDWQQNTARMLEGGLCEPGL